VRPVVIFIGLESILESVPRPRLSLLSVTTKLVRPVGRESVTIALFAYPGPLFSILTVNLASSLLKSILSAVFVIDVLLLQCL